MSLQLTHLCFGFSLSSNGQAATSVPPAMSNRKRGRSPSGAAAGSSTPPEVRPRTSLAADRVGILRFACGATGEMYIQSQPTPTGRLIQGPVESALNVKLRAEENGIYRIKLLVCHTFDQE